MVHAPGGRAVTHIKAWWSLSRPPLMGCVLLLVLAGFAWGHWNEALTLRGQGRLAWVMAGWACLHLGTMWLNARLDQDDGPVLWGYPAAVPLHLGAGAYVCLALCLACAAQAGFVLFWAAVFAVGLAVAYSHPRTCWKGHPVWGPGTNVLGYGILSPMAGWWVVGTPFDARTGVVLLGGMSGVLGVYFLAQFFQGSEDAKRGYRTRVVTHGSEATVAAARMALRVAWGLGLGLLLAGWLPRPLLCVYPVVWAHDRAMGAAGPTNGREGARRAKRLILQLGGLVAMCLLIATMVYVWDSFHGENVAGQATSSGHSQ